MFRAASERHTIPLFPVTGMGTFCRVQLSLRVMWLAPSSSRVWKWAKVTLGGKTLGPVLRPSTHHPQFTCLVHQAPGHRGPLGPQQAEGGEGPQSTLDESLAPLIATKMPEFIHQGSAGHIQGGELKHLLVCIGNKRKKQPIISPVL